MNRSLKFLQNPHFWLILTMFIVGITLHYPQYIPFLNINLNSLLGLSGHAVGRVLFLLPVIYAGYMVGIKWGLISLGIAFAVMLPRAIFISLYPTDTLFEIGVVILIGSLVNWRFECSRGEKGRREQDLLKLEAEQHEFQSYIQGIKDDKEYLTIINAISKAASGSLEINQVLNAAADKLMEIMDVDALLAFTLCDESKELRLEVHRGVSKEFASKMERINLGEGFNGRVAQSGEPLLVEDASSDTRVSREVVKKEGIKSQYIVPLKSKGSVMGTLCVALHRIKQFTSWEKKFLTTIGDAIGVALGNARLYQECSEAGEKAKISERNYRELFEMALDPIWVQDLEGKITAGNEASAKLMGCEREELIGMKVTQFLTPEGLELARELRRKLLRGEAMNQPYEQSLIRKDGVEIMLKLTTTPIRGGEGIKAFQHIARDITKERKLQENLRFYIQQITEAQEEERGRIARELHDDTVQALVVLSRKLDSFTLRNGQVPEELLQFLEGIQKDVDEIMQGVRRFGQDLRPPLLEFLGLLPALRELVSQMEGQYEINMNLKVVGHERRLPPETELGLYRIVQEALRNVGKHSEANEAEVIVEFSDEKAQITINDNGKGFRQPEKLDDLARIGKLGLVGIKERAHLLRGNLIIQSEPDKGTTLIMETPMA
jgi:PAS domain S-box-containing protein